MTCPRCAAPLPPNSLFCNRCGNKMSPNEAPPSGNAARWVIVVAGAVLVTGVMGSLLASGALDGYLSELDDSKPYIVPSTPEKPLQPTSGAAAQPSSSPSTKSPPSSGPAPKANPTPTPTAFTVNLDSNPQGATVVELDGTAIGQTPTSVVLPATTIVEFSLNGFDDTCRFELSAKIKDQTIKCNFKKPSPNQDSVKPVNTPPPSSAPSKKKEVNDESIPPVKKTPPSSAPAKKKTPSSAPSE
jgi:hypothetical protein